MRDLTQNIYDRIRSLYGMRGILSELAERQREVSPPSNLYLGLEYLAFRLDAEVGAIEAALTEQMLQRSSPPQVEMVKRWRDDPKPCTC